MTQQPDIQTIAREALALGDVIRAQSLGVNPIPPPDDVIEQAVSLLDALAAEVLRLGEEVARLNTFIQAGRVLREGEDHE